MLILPEFTLVASRFIIPITASIAVNIAAYVLKADCEEEGVENMEFATRDRKALLYFTVVDAGGIIHGDKVNVDPSLVVGSGGLYTLLEIGIGDGGVISVPPLVYILFIELPGEARRHELAIVSAVVQTS